MVGFGDRDPLSPLVSSEMVLDALTGFTPAVEIIAPGTYLVPALGPSRYHGGEEALAHQVHRSVVRVLGATGRERPAVVVTIAGGPGVSALVARSVLTASTSGGGPGRGVGQEPVQVLGDGADVDHLAALPIGHVAHLLDPGTVELFRRLGLVTIGAFAALSTADVRSRFGPEVAEVHRLVNGAEREPSRPVVPQEDMAVAELLEPPLATVDQMAFVARSMAHDLMERLSSRSLGADTLHITIGTDLGRSVERVWRVERGLSVSVITQRVRWQAEGWLRSRRGTDRPPKGDGHGDSDLHSDLGAISSIRIEPGDLHPYRGTQMGFWGGSDDHDRLVLGGVDRIRGLFGVDSVKVPRLRGGRSPHQSHRMVDVDDGCRSGGAQGVVARGADGDQLDGPWPGSIPDPLPTRVWSDPIPAELVDAEGHLVGVSGRGVISSTPELLSVDGGPWSKVMKWAGPWCVDERWWDPVGHRRKARLQVLVEPPGGLVADHPRADRPRRDHPRRMSRQVSPQAHLLTLEVGEWWVEATYD